MLSGQPAGRRPYKSRINLAEVVELADTPS